MGKNLNNHKGAHDMRITHTCKERSRESQEVKHLKEEIKKLKEQLSLFLNANCKMHPKTLQKLNKTLQHENKPPVHGDSNSQHGNNNTMNINKNTCIQNINHYHQTHNNIQIVELGKENVVEMFTDNIEKAILRKRSNSLNLLIDLVHYSKSSPQCHNIIITNVNNNIAYSYNKRLNRFIAVNKNDLLEKLIEYRRRRPRRNV